MASERTVEQQRASAKMVVVKRIVAIRYVVCLALAVAWRVKKEFSGSVRSVEERLGSEAQVEKVVIGEDEEEETKVRIYDLTANVRLDMLTEYSSG